MSCYNKPKKAHTVDVLTMKTKEIRQKKDIIHVMLYYIITYSYNNISFKLMVLKNIINIFVSFKLDLFCIVSNRNIVVD